MTRFYLLSALLALTIGCSSSTSGPGGGGNKKLEEYSTPQNYAMVVGTVKNPEGSPIGDVEVSVGGLKVSTNNQGYFALAQIPENPATVVNFKKATFIPQTKRLHTRIGESSFLEVTLAPQAGAATFSAGAGVNASNGGARVIIPPGSLILPDGNAYTGPAKISVTAFDPSTASGHKAFPGNFEGVQADGEVIPFRSLGFVDITPTTPEGVPLQLREGAEAEIEVPIGPSLLASAPDTLPLWFFNTQDGQWHEEGVAVRSGNIYRSKVRHFSIWNCDVGLRRAWVIGRVINCTEDGRPVKGARVTIQNVFAGWSSGESSTPDDGTFRIPVNANEPVNLWADKGGLKSAVKNFTAPGRDQTYDVGDICLGVPKVQIVLTWGIQPVDLDAHLTIPTANQRSHLFFSRKNIGNANLDTDDTSSFGPEIVSVFKLHNGMYRYSVHHFSGEGNISTSKAHVHMTIEGQGIFQMDPPGNARGRGDLWVLWDFEVRDGRVVNILPRANMVEAAAAGQKYNP